MGHMLRGVAEIIDEFEVELFLERLNFTVRILVPYT